MTRELYELENHACRICGGRVLRRRLESGQSVVRCCECGATATAAASNDRPFRLICFCGANVLNGQDARLRCQINTSKTLQSPQEVVVGYVAQDQEKPLAPKPPRPIRSAGGFDGF